MATVHKLRPIYPVDGADERDFSYRNRPIATSPEQSFKKGAPLIPGAGTGELGHVKEPTDNATATGILGFATSDAAGYEWEYNTLGDVVPGMPFATSDQEFRGTYKASDIADVKALIGTSKDLAKDSSDYWVVASSNSAARVKITGIDDAAQNGDTDIPVTFVVLAAQQGVIK